VNHRAKATRAMIPRFTRTQDSMKLPLFLDIMTSLSCVGTTRGGYHVCVFC
jgi:hypothetical protein